MSSEQQGKVDPVVAMLIKTLQDMLLELAAFTKNFNGAIWKAACILFCQIPVFCRV